VRDRFRTGGETQGTATAPAKAEKATVKTPSPTAEKTAALKAVSAPEKTKAADTTAEKPAEKAKEVEKAEEPAEKSQPAPNYPWKRGKPSVVIQSPEVQAPVPAPEETEEFDNLPVLELLGWLESHAPKEFLEVHLRQICEEVELMQHA
jgi:hypothetical protein